MGKREEWVDPKSSRRIAKRGLRATHKARMKDKAIDIRKRWNIGELSDEQIKNAIKTADHLKCCSCWMCGSARKHWGITFAEKRALSGHDYEE